MLRIFSDTHVMINVRDTLIMKSCLNDTESNTACFM